MDGIVNFLNTNKEWLFNGTGTEVIVGIISVTCGIVFWLLKKNNATKKQTIGNNSSNNNQAGRDIKIK